MGKALLLMAASVMVAGGILLYSGPTSASIESEHRAAEHGAQSLAREVAMTGYNWAVQRVQKELLAVATGDFEGSYLDGAYDVSITRDGDLVSVVSVGTVPLADGSEATHTVEATFEYKIAWRGPSADDALPEFLEFGTIAEDDISLQGNVQACVFNPSTAACDNGTLELNHNIHSNGELTVGGNSGNWKGFGSSVVASSSQPGKLNNWFNPNHNPGAAPDYAQASYVNLPDWSDPTYFQNEILGKMWVDHSTGDVSLNGTLDMGGTREDPFVWHVNGNLTTNNVTIDGYMIFLVDGDLNFSGNALVGESGYSEKDESSVAYYSTGNAVIAGNRQVWGQVFTSGHISNGGAQVYGTVTSSGTASFSGNPDVRYRMASPKLARPFKEGHEGEIMDFVRYEEFGSLDRDPS